MEKEFDFDISELTDDELEHLKYFYQGADLADIRRWQATAPDPCQFCKDILAKLPDSVSATDANNG